MLEGLQVMSQKELYPSLVFQIAANFYEALCQVFH